MKKDDTKKQLRRMRDDLTQLRDEIRVKLHLAGMDAKDELSRLEPQIDAFERRAEATSEEVSAELKEAWTHLKKALQRVRDNVYAKSA